jgi:hypothetical protein
MANTENRIHPWEKAGLGKAPFTWLRVECRVGPIKTELPDGTTLEQGAPGQPMGCCDYCSNGIAECHVIRSADGREFIVGCDCVRKVNAKGSRVLAAAEQAAQNLRNAKARERRAAKAERDSAEIQSLLGDPAWRERAASKPHPLAWRAEQGDTRLDYAEWMFQNSGASGRGRLLKAIREW